jgi:predicted alpha/beta superfamily hydrolase
MVFLRLGYGQIVLTMKFYIAVMFLVFSFAKDVFPQKTEILSLHSKVFNNTRSIRVYLPPGYYRSYKHYPVLYMNDGIATFDAYDIENLVDSLINHKLIEPVIIVGIDNGGSVKNSKNPVRDRANEYLPWPDINESVESNKIEKPIGSKYPYFLFDEVMPLINQKFKTKTGRLNTGLGGASYGALIALYTAASRSNKIGLLLLESPSLYVHNQQIFKMLKKMPEFPKTYIGIGTKEGTTSIIQRTALEDAKKLNNILCNDYGRDKVWIKIEEGAGHNYDFFSERFPAALNFLYGRTN